jgi:transposase-like protein
VKGKLIRKSLKTDALTVAKLRLLEVLLGIKTVAEIAHEHQVHPTQVSQWKRVIVERLPEMFEHGATAQRGAHPSLVCHRRLPARRHFEKTSASECQPLHHFTDFEPHTFLRNAHFTGSFSTPTTISANR